MSYTSARKGLKTLTTTFSITQRATDTLLGDNDVNNLNPTPFQATLRSIVTLAPNIKGYALQCVHPDFRRRPGQWLQLSHQIDGETHTASFSAASSTQHLGHIELAIKASDSHPLTRWLHNTAQVGEQIAISAGQGDFFYTPEMSQRVVLIGAGTGITPLISIFRYIAEEVPQTDATLIYSIASTEEYLFRQDIEHLSQGDRLHHLVTLTKADAAWPGLTGRINAALLQQAGIDTNTLYYLCGPQAMVDEISELLLQLGVPAENTVFEKWW